MFLTRVSILDHFVLIRHSNVQHFRQRGRTRSNNAPCTEQCDLFDKVKRPIGARYVGNGGPPTAMTDLESVTVFEGFAARLRRIEDERLPLRGPQTRDPTDISPPCDALTKPRPAEESCAAVCFPSPVAIFAPLFVHLGYVQPVGSSCDRTRMHDDLNMARATRCSSHEKYSKASLVGIIKTAGSRNRISIIRDRITRDVCALIRLTG